MWDSIVVLKKNRLTGAAASVLISCPLVVATGFISAGEGATRLRKFIMRCTHMLCLEEMQKTGNMPRLTKPALMPARRSSSLSVPSSKNFSIRASSFSAAASTRAFCHSAAFSASSAGISKTSGAASPCFFHRYIFIFSTSTMASNEAPALVGY
ncbi:hypothetical protein Barb6_03861 [Bacteroidales bacterium Barb6]|nr:hypothetical protein Barb6_03861 [Bacteroidales bacterium Barb6]